jgi:hypothetical protein
MHWKELIVVLGIALILFKAAQPLARAYMSEADFVRRRNVWLFLTVCAFVSPDFWLYAGVAALTLAWAGRRDPNPGALFVMAFSIIPPVEFYIPVIGINTLFSLNQARILSLVLLLPFALRLFMRNEGGLARRWMLLDVLLLAYIVLQVMLVTPFESFTNTLRRSFLFGVDTLIVYYVFSRSMISRRAITEVMAGFTLVCIVYAGIGVFEWLKGWLMYEQIPLGWGQPYLGYFLLRGDELRAEASAGHSLTLGYMLAVAFGFWLYLRGAVASAPLRAVVTMLLCVAMYATQSRGPWLTAALIFLLHLLISPAGRSKFFRSLSAALVAGAVLIATPFGQSIIDRLPFIGTVDQDNVLYRQRLAEESWRLVWQNPLFGDPFVASRMEDLRQGQGIIDLMNAYAAVALFTGLVGLALFAGSFVLATVRTFALQRRVRERWPEVSVVGATLVTCMVGSLFFMATASIDWIEYVLLGCMAGYVGAYALAGTAAATPTGTVGGGAQRYAVGK